MDLEILLRKLEREKNARLEAEKILEEKSLELYESNLKLQKLVNSLEEEVERRTEEIRQSENNLFIMFEKHPFPMMVYDPKSFVILGVNETAIKKYGYSRGEFIQMKITDLHHKDDVKTVVQHVKDIENESHTIKEWKHYVKSKDCIDVEINGITIDYQNKEARLVVIIDITEKKRIEAEKKQNERRYKELVENVTDFIYRISDKGIITYMNPTAIHAIGYPEDEVVGNSFLNFVRADYKAGLMGLIHNQLVGKIQSAYFEFPVVAKNKKTIWLGQTTDTHEMPNGDIEYIAMSRDITERKLIKDELKRSEEKYRNIMENMELGLLEVDVNGFITNAYPKFCDLSGYNRDELIGLEAATTLLHERFLAQMKEQEERRRNGDPGVYEVQLKRKDGSYTWVIISGAPYYDQEGNLAGTVGIHLDISERKAVEEKLEEAKILAENSVRSKELFMANMSHEIRTPMNAIIGMSELLKKSELKDKQRKYVDAIGTSADNLLIIINDILDFSKIESGKLRLDKVPSDLRHLLETSIKTVELKAEEKGLQINQHLDEKLGTYLFDPTRLNQVMLNLLSNAVKFTEAGSIDVVCKVVNSDSVTHNLLFEVSDTGIGINKDKLETIFESFIQAEESTTRHYGGTGLGLAISKQLVEMMGGQLIAHSEKGIGSRFSFTIACETTSPVQKQEINNTTDETEVRELKVLLVEDNDINRFMALTILEGWECIVEVAVNGREAISTLEKNTYDIILMDVRMPVLDGISATKIIRNDLKIKTPIIALTANAIKGDNEACLAAGMNDYISKPFQQADLLALLIKYGVKQISPKESIPAAESETVEENEGKNLVDLTKLRETTNNDTSFMTKMIQLFVKDTPPQLDDMKQAVEDGNWNEARKIAHRIKPSIDYLAVRALQDEVRSIETGSDPDLNQALNFIKNIRLLVEALKSS